MEAEERNMTDEAPMTQDEHGAAGTQPGASEAVNTSEAPAADGGQPSEPVAAPDRIAELERQLVAERDAAADYLQRWQRAQADFSNFRRRTQQEQEQRDALVTARTLATILPALDAFERAFTTLPDSLRGLSWIDGVALVELQLRRALDALGVQPLTVEPGQAFDPMRHESIGELETGDHPAGHVATVVQQGYEVRGLLLRPALVQLARERASAPASAESPGSEEPQEEHGAHGSPAAAEHMVSAEAPEAAGAEGTSP
jgi:molecular chaperone GrpE